MYRFLLTAAFCFVCTSSSQGNGTGTARDNDTVGNNGTPTPTGSSTFPPQYPQSVTEYYSSIDMNAKDEELKSQLHALINPHKVLTYDEVKIIPS